MTLSLSEIQIRDPFILPVGSEGAYYLFGSTDADIWKGPAVGFDCYRSADLVRWDGPHPAFRPPEGFWADQNFWAPEVHEHAGRWFMFATFKADGVPRGTQALVADHPAGPYRPHSRDRLTPARWECLDGTLHVDDAGQPWLVFCHEWVQVGDGTVCAQRLTDALDDTVGDVTVLFSASEAPWAEEVHSSRHGPGHVTDGPFLHRTGDGTLLLLWASFRDGRYAQGLARSRSGHVLGPWDHVSDPLHASDGGHGMCFRTWSGDLHLALHTPNHTPAERAVLVPLVEEGGLLHVANHPTNEEAR